MAGSQVSKTVSIDWFSSIIYGNAPITIDEYDTDAEPEVQPGKIEVGNDIYLFSSAESITGWSGISVSTQAYIYFVPSGTSCTVVFSATAPTWDSQKHGWYNGNNRAMWAVYKDAAGTGYCHKQELKGRSVTTTGTTVSSVTHAGNPTNGTDFTVYEPGLYYAKFTDNGYSGGVYVVLEAKVNSTYTDYDGSLSNEQNVVYYRETSTAKSLSFFHILTPGTYRMVLVGAIAGGPPTCTLYRAGRLSNNA